MRERPTGGGTGAMLPLVFLLAVGLAAATFLLLPWGGDGPRESGGEPIRLSSVLGAAPDAGFERAEGPRPFRFPRDHGPHAGFRNEWWYFTGNLETGSGRRFGYQLTVFRNALAPPDGSPGGEDRRSRWSTRQLYMAHFAVTDVAAASFTAADRFSRGALGLAGARARPFRLWLEDWVVHTIPGSDAGDRPFPLRLRASHPAPLPLPRRPAPGRDTRVGEAPDDTRGVAIDLRLDRAKPLVLQGRRGYSRKGDDPGNASFYYSYTRLPTEGTVTVEGVDHRVTGRSWLDREWSTSALDDDQEGWDWFSLQLSDGHDLMFYRLRRRDGTSSPYSSGLVVDPDGRTSRLRVDDVELRVMDRWRSPRSGVSYPSGWQLSVPRLELEVTVEPLLDDQELDLAFRYWEGAVRVEGHRAGRPLDGTGYVELTGYGERDFQTSSVRSSVGNR